MFYLFIFYKLCYYLTYLFMNFLKLLRNCGLLCCCAFVPSLPDRLLWI